MMMKAISFFVIVVFPEIVGISLICFDFLVEFNILFLFLIVRLKHIGHKGPLKNKARQSPEHVRFHNIY